MPITPATADPFNAIAEPRRRELIELLAGKELTVGEMVERLGWNQPSVSKHLRVLKQVDIVSERKQGRHRLYRVNSDRLQPIRNWLVQLHQHWDNSLDNLGEYLSDVQSEKSQNKEPDHDRRK